MSDFDTKVKAAYKAAAVPERQPIAATAQSPASAPEASRSHRLREAGYTARDHRLTCDECGAKFTAQMAPLHECEQPPVQLTGGANG